MTFPTKEVLREYAFVVFYPNVYKQTITCCYGQPCVHGDAHKYNHHSYLYRTGYIENGKLHTVG